MGLSAQTLAQLLSTKGWQISGTVRTREKAASLTAKGYHMHVWERGAPLPTDALQGVTHALLSLLPDAGGDQMASDIGPALATLPDIRWVGYLSSTGVYGDYDGDWIDEDSPRTPNTERSQRRLKAEQDWQAVPDLPLHIFRIAGIYGPGRNQLAKLRDGTAQRIIKPGHVFCRIHVDDIAQVLAASMERPNPGRAYNIADDEPAPPQDVLSYGAQLLGLPEPPSVPFDAAELSPMARSFYAATKRVRNDRIKQELGVTLKYPTYREGLRALVSDKG